MKRQNKNMHGDALTQYELLGARDLAAQYLLHYEMSLSYVLDLNNQLDIDKIAMCFTTILRTLSTNEMLMLKQHVQPWLKQNAPALRGRDDSGTVMMFAHMGKRNIISMLDGTTVALVLLELLLILALRSSKIGLVSLVPNLVPAALGFGLWGMMVREVGLALSVVRWKALWLTIPSTS